MKEISLLRYARVALLLAAAASSLPRSAAAEQDLQRVIDHALAASAEQYGHALAQLTENGRLPRTYEHGKLVTVSSSDWTSGFFPGSLWYLFEATGDRKWRDAAEKFTALIEPEQHNKDTHDVGFMLYCSFGNGLRLTQNESYRKVLLTGASSLASRYNPNVGALKSWDWSQAWDFPVIVDNMMNLELMMWAEKTAPGKGFGNIARRHADTTLQHHFRADHSSYHVVDYDPASGAVKSKVTHQGAADGSAWARGQAWGLYGYTLMFRETRDPRYLEQARRIAHFIMNHPRLPKDKVPYWDFDAPDIPDAPRDSSAAAIICSALLELRGFVDQPLAAEYSRFAEHQLRSLASLTYLAKPGENGGFLLKHATGHMPKKSEIDTPLVYGDYYFLEALLRAKK